MADSPVLERVLPPAPRFFQGNELAPSPFSFLFSGEDRLRVHSRNSLSGAVVTIQGRWLDPDEVIVPFTARHTPNADRTAASEEIPVGLGYLLNLTVFVSAGAPLIGQTFIRLEVIRGSGDAATALGTLVQGYIGAAQHLAWPGSPIRSSTEGEPVLRVITGSDPSAGNEVNETVPAGARWELVTFQVILQADGTVASRRPLVALDDGSTTYYSAATSGHAQANDLAGFTWAQGLVNDPSVTDQHRQGSLPLNVALLAGSRVRTSTANLQGGDNWQAPQYVVREWLEAA